MRDCRPYPFSTCACLLALLVALAAMPLQGAEVHVAADGDDAAAGTPTHPLRTLAAAQRAARAARSQAPGKPVRVLLHQGTYYLPETLVLGPEDSGTAGAPTVYAGVPGDQVVLSGGMHLELSWKPYRDGIMQASVPAGTAFDQLFVGGKRQPMARYPNADPSISHYEGYAGDAISPERVARWKDPAGGFIHALHAAEWGGYSYQITGKNADGTLAYVGGWQNNRPMGMHSTYRMVENIFEELDAPGEWFLDTKRSILYYYPLPGVDMAQAMVEGARLRQVVTMGGTRQKPVHFVTIEHLVIRHAARTFMENKEPLLRSDWTCYRGGAVLVQGAEDCTIRDCWFDQVGGNAVFISGYARRVTVASCHIDHCGGNGVAVVGEPSAVRNPLLNYDKHQDLAAIDRTPGPQTEDYPADCLIDDCLIHSCGRFEKQTAPVDIDMAERITVRDCSLYDCPRAGLNIGDGCWGGDVVEGCDIFDTVLETGDNGSFNSWGRDRYWNLGGVDLNAIAGTALAGLPLLDVVTPNLLRHNRWRCDHGWDIDLDDGSSNYRITDNLCLHGGIKLREGFLRVVENNVMVGCSLHSHVWFRDSQDIIRHNIVGTPYQPIGMPSPWGSICDENLLHHGGGATVPALGLKAQSGRDEHSQEGDAHFIDPEHGDYRVAPGSPALALGFVNFPMDHFGVRSPALRALARQARLPAVAVPGAAVTGTRDEMVCGWLGARIKNLAGLGEISATGSPGETGVIVQEVAAGSPAAAAGLRPLDVIRALGGAPMVTVSDLLLAYGRGDPSHAAALGVWRAQHDATASLAGGQSIVLSPGTATMRGEGQHPGFDSGKDYLGSWTNERAELAWTAVQAAPGTYDVAVILAAPHEHAGSTFMLTVGTIELNGRVPGTGGWDQFAALPLGSVKLEAAPGGGWTVVLHPVVKPGLAVMNLRGVILTRR